MRKMSTILGPDIFPVRGRKHSRQRVGSLKVETEELATTYLTSSAFSEERSLRSVEEVNRGTGPPTLTTF